MKKLKSSLTNMVAVLTGTALLSAGLLAGVNQLTKDSIKEQNEKQLSEGIKTVMGNDGVTVVSTDSVKMVIDSDTCHYIVYSVNGENSKPLGCAVESSTMGFGGILKVLVGFDENGTVLGYRILQSQETPGLGQKADQWFQKDGKGCIVGKRMLSSHPLAIGKEDGQVDAITASTITSKAFIKAVNNAYGAFVQLRENAENRHVDMTTGASAKHHTDVNTGASIKGERHSKHGNE